MRPRIVFAFGASLLLLASSAVLAQNKPCPTIEPKVIDAKFKPGQVWAYQTRPGESASTVTILQIDRMNKPGIIVHIRVDGLRMRNPNGDLVPSIEHMPFTRDAFLLSVNKLLRVESSLPTLEGYDRWRADCGGVYTLSIADAVSVADKTLNSP